MKIIIAGHGRVGSMLTRQLASEGHEITVIDLDTQIRQSSVLHYDVMSLQGNCASMEVLLKAGVKDADLLIAATNQDEVNLLCCTTAHYLNRKLHTIARIRNPEYTQQIHRMRNIFGLSMDINPELQTAVEIERLLKYPGFLRRDTFARGNTEIVELRVDEGSKLCNVRLMDMRNIVNCQVLVCAVIRDGSAIAPKGDFVLQEGDRIFVTALSKNLEILLKNLGILTRRVRSVTICGGGRISYYLANHLLRSNIRVKIVERDPARCNELSELLPDVDLFQLDVSDQDLMESEGLLQSDALVSITGMDELNIILSLYARSRGIPQVITKLNNSSSRAVIGSLSLGSSINPRELVCSNIVRYVRAMENQSGAAITVHTIADGQAEALEFLVDETTKNCGLPLKEIKLKPNILLVSISHGSHTEIANGNSVFHEGDTVVVVDTNRREVIRQLNDIFA